jgi:hypothetical protein
MSGAAAAGAAVGGGQAAGGGASAGGAPAGGAASGASAGAAPAQGAGSAPGLSTNTAAPSHNGAGATATDWTSGLPQDLQGYAQNKGWKDVGQLTDSYRNLEKLAGAPREQLMVIPRTDDAEAMGKMYERLGRPATPDKYGLETPKDLGNPEFTKWAAGEFHKAGLSDAQAKAILNGWHARLGETRAARTATEAAKQVGEVDALKKEWGAAYDQERAVAQAGAREFGIDLPTIDSLEKSMGTLKTLKLLNAIGKRIGEAKFHGGSQVADPTHGPMTPAQAKEQIKNLQSDNAFIKKYHEGDQASRSTMERLHKYAFPEAG